MCASLKGAAAALLLTIGAGSATAQLVPDFEFVPADATGLDGFGLAVATNGSLGVVGALFQGEDVGAAYIYDLATGEQLHKLLPETIGAGDNFGRAVAINDEHAFVSSIWHGGNGTVFVFDLQTGELVREIVAPDGNVDDRFGASLAVDGDALAVGCPYDDWAGDWSGSVYVFDVLSGQQRIKFEWDETQPYDTYGVDVDIQGDLIAIGASGDSRVFDIAGRAYVMNWVTGELMTALVPEDLEEIGKFGQSVAFSGEHVLVGAPSHDTGWGVNAGAAYVFKVDGGAQKHKLVGSAGQALGFFGEFLDTDGDRAVIGQWYGITPGDSQGKAFLYEVSSGTELEVLTAPNGVDYDLFGSAVAIAGSSVLVGAYATDRGQLDVGSVYSYTVAGACRADLTGDGELNFFDVSAFISAFGDQDPSADFTGDGALNFFDVSAFVSAFSAGCP